jgi:hypothetical protein
MARIRGPAAHKRTLKAEASQYRREEEAREAGKKAFFEGVMVCPYPHSHTRLREIWLKAYRYASEQFGKECLEQGQRAAENGGILPS